MNFVILLLMAFLAKEGLDIKTPCSIGKEQIHIAMNALHSRKILSLDNNIVSIEVADQVGLKTFFELITSTILCLLFFVGHWGINPDSWILIQ